MVTNPTESREAIGVGEVPFHDLDGFYIEIPCVATATVEITIHEDREWDYEVTDVREGW